MIDTRNILTEELEALKERIIDNHRRAGQVASGKTIQSLTVEASETSGVLFGRKAFSTLETGRAAGATPKGFRQIIEQWIINKGIPVEPIPYKRNVKNQLYSPEQRGLIRLSSAIAHKIQTEGTKLYRSGGRADIYTPEVKQTVEYIMKRLSNLFMVKIDTITLNDNGNETN